MLLSMKDNKILTIEQLLACHLSRSIRFIANDCGNNGSRKEQIANWVYTIFLKAKSEAKSEANKQDRSTWSEAMNGPFNEECWKAAVKDLNTLKVMDAWEVVDQTNGMNVIDLIWAFRLKNPDGLVVKNF